MKTDILILGAGIGGYEAFRSLAKALKKNRIQKTITLIDKNNYFTFVPMLHEAAAGSVEPNHCAVPLRELTHKTPHQFIRTKVKSIDPSKKSVKTSRGEISYEYCVVALGSTTNYFGIPGAEEYTYHVRSLSGAMKLHHDLIEKLEDCDTCEVDLVIVGGGYTGVEIAGQFCDFASKDITTLYPETKLNIHIVESGDLLLKVMSDKVRRKVTTRLEKLGVKVHLNERVKEVKENKVVLESGKEIQSTMTIWTTGFQNIADQFFPKTHTEKGRVLVTHELTSTNNNSLYAIGDIALLKDEKEIPYPQLAEAAHREGMFVARHIARRIKGKKNKPFFFKAKGTLMPVGDWWGVLTVGKFILFGRLAWWIRRTVYLFFMPGIIRKIKIAFDWTIHGFGFRYILDTDDDSK